MGNSTGWKRSLNMAMRVVSGHSKFCLAQGDSLKLLSQMPEKSVDLVVGSPPYEERRHYGEIKDRQLSGQAWVDWVVKFFEAAVPVSKGLVALVVGHGETVNYEWSATPALLMADLKRKGFVQRCPLAYNRVSFGGGPDYFRPDFEFVVVVQNGQGRLPWSNNCAGGKPPKFRPGGSYSHREEDGRRINHQSRRKPSGENPRKTYTPPVIANPGSVLERTYTAGEVEKILEAYEYSSATKGLVGGGHMGSSLAHLNEAPYPLWLAERYVLAFCPPGGVVLDPFSGSGTTVEAAVMNGRRAIGFDLRPCQVELASRRMRNVTPKLFVQEDEEYLRRVEAQGQKKKKARPDDQEGPEGGAGRRLPVAEAGADEGAPRPGPRANGRVRKVEGNGAPGASGARAQAAKVAG
jgi:hypothetical protein